MSKNLERQTAKTHSNFERLLPVTKAIQTQNCAVSNFTPNLLLQSEDACLHSKPTPAIDPHQKQKGHRFPIAAHVGAPKMEAKSKGNGWKQSAHWMGLYCPSRWIRSCACCSTAGFHLEKTRDNRQSEKQSINRDEERILNTWRWGGQAKKEAMFWCQQVYFWNRGGSHTLDDDPSFSNKERFEDLMSKHASSKRPLEKSKFTRGP